MTTLYREVMAITRAVIRDVEAVGRQLTTPRDEMVARLGRHPEETVGLVRRVLAQARARVLKATPITPTRC